MEIWRKINTGGMVYLKPNLVGRNILCNIVYIRHLSKKGDMKTSLVILGKEKQPFTGCKVAKISAEIGLEKPLKPCCIFNVSKR